jgi:hypothetical protein
LRAQPKDLSISATHVREILRELRRMTGTAQGVTAFDTENVSLPSSKLAS